MGSLKEVRGEVVEFLAKSRTTSPMAAESLHYDVLFDSEDCQE